MTTSEKLMLFCLVYAKKPKNCLEIGTFKGGSTAIIHKALTALNSGKLIAVDVNFNEVAPSRKNDLLDRVTFLKGKSPEILTKAYEIAGEPFDFVLVDGDHSYDGVLKDCEALEPIMKNGALILFHDSNNKEVRSAIDFWIKKWLPKWFYKDISDFSNFDDAYERWDGFRSVRWENPHLVF